MSSHPQHLEQLQRVLVSDAHVLEEFEASEFAGCGECRRLVNDHVRLLGDLQELGDDERESITASDQVVAPPGRAEQALRDHIRATTTSRSKRNWVLALSGLAAAVLALLIFVPNREATQVRDNRVLGPESGLLHPVERVESYVPFRWNVQCPAGGHFIVRVEGDGFELASERLYESEWSPTDAIDWPSKIRWTLEVYRSSGPGDVFASHVQWAER